MAAIKTVTLESGISVENAVHRIESVTLGYKNQMSYKVRVYTALDKPAFLELDGSCEYQGGDVYAECYAHLNADGSYEAA